MSPAQLMIENAKIAAKIEKTSIEQETRLRKLEIGNQNLEMGRPEFNVAKQAWLILSFREEMIDEYFACFEKATMNLSWPKEAWPMLLRTVLCERAQRTYIALAVEDGSDYDIVRMAILRCLELVPEPYRQRFRCSIKVEEQTDVELADKKEELRSL